jgi:hypothetical protein
MKIFFEICGDALGVACIFLMLYVGLVAGSIMEEEPPAIESH